MSCEANTLFWRQSCSFCGFPRSPRLLVSLPNALTTLRVLAFYRLSGSVANSASIRARLLNGLGEAARPCQGDGVVTADLLQAATSCANNYRCGDRARERAAVGGSSARSAIASAASVGRPAQRARGFARLDNITKRVSQPGESARRRDRYRLRSVLWEESTLRRVQMCGRRRIRNDKVGVYVTAERRAHFGNVQCCGSVHACPVCGTKIRRRRATEIDTAVRCHISAGGDVLFQTFTLPHDFGDELAPLLEAVADAFRRVIGGRGYKADKLDYSISGTIRASETTFGKAGAHPHLHVLLFCDRHLAASEVRMLNARLFARWASAVESFGYRAPLIGLCPIERVTSRGVAEYVQKMIMTEDTKRRIGMEMTRHDLKGARRQGRTPFQVLRDFEASGDCADLELWREWERASQGTQSLTWSKGLKARYTVKDASDEEIAAERVGGELVAELTVDQWNLVNGEQFGGLALLEAAEESGADGIHFWLFVAEIRRHKRERHNAPLLRAA
jgi:hypothetical protein